jgi:hypothetical protein
VILIDQTTAFADADFLSGALRRSMISLPRALERFSGLSIFCRADQL